MTRALAFLALSLISSPLLAGTGGEIAYSVGREVYLINQDGSGKRLLYRGATGTSIFSITMKSNGGELSFEEVGKTGQNGRLITISYGPSGAGSVTRNISGCRWNASTRDDGALLAVDSCNGRVNFIPAGSSTQTDLGIVQSTKVSWMPDGSFLYTSGGTIRLGSLANPTGSQISVQDCVQNLNGAHTASEALVSVGSVCDGPRIDRMLVPSGSVTHIAAGPDAAYSQDDACYIFISPVRRGAHLLIAPIDGGSGSKPLGSYADYKSVDWRGDSQPTTCQVAASNPLQFREVK
jgi:hypothetical protein